MDKLMKCINSIMIDSSNSTTDLCLLGKKYGTDKSPYNTKLHRHPYTAIYDLLFASQRYAPIKFAEIGILDNSSMKMWRDYFHRAKLYGFDVSKASIELARRDLLPDVYYDWLDADNKDTIHSALDKAKSLFDVIIDDSSHYFEHQIAIISQAYKFIKPGGMLIIEDIHRPWGNEKYEEALAPYAGYFSSLTFIEAEHSNKYSDGTEVPWFDNDKLLLMHRNRVPIATFIAN